MNIAFIGMGTMGAAMALNLLKAGYAVTVHNRTREREAPLAEAGTQFAVTELMESSDGGATRTLPMASVEVVVRSAAPTVVPGTPGSGT